MRETSIEAFKRAMLAQDFLDDIREFNRWKKRRDKLRANKEKKRNIEHPAKSAQIRPEIGISIALCNNLNNPTLNRNIQDIIETKE